MRAAGTERFDAPADGPQGSAAALNSDSPRYPSHYSLGDLFVGALVGVMGASNLVQGIWIDRLPWLNLTTLSYALSLPIAVLLLFRGGRQRGFGVWLILVASVAIGYYTPELNSAAPDKRSALLLGVVYTFLVGILALTNTQRLNSFFLTLVGCALVVAAGQVLVPDAAMLVLGRRTPVGDNPISAGRALGAGLVVTTGFVVSRGKARKSQFLWLLVSGLFLIGLVSTGSRGPVLGVISAVGIVLWGMPQLNRAWRLPVGMGLLALTYLGYTRLTTTETRLAASTDSGRDSLFSAALNIGSENPIGVGWGNFYNYLNPAQVLTNQGYNQYPHNIVLEFFAEAGWVSTALFLVVVLVVARAAIIRRHTETGLLLACLVAFTFVSALFSSDVVGNRLLWVVLAATLVAKGVPSTPPKMVGEARRVQV